MPYVVKDASTGNYFCSSKSKKVDPKNVVYAKVYPTAAGATSAARYNQYLHMQWFETEEFLLKRDGELPCGNEPHYHGVAPNFIVEEI
jgi:hypothetical protein